MGRLTRIVQVDQFDHRILMEEGQRGHFRGDVTAEAEVRGTGITKQGTQAACGS